MKHLNTYGSYIKEYKEMNLTDYLDLFKAFLKQHNIYYYYKSKVDIDNLINELNPLDWIIHPYNNVSDFWDYIPGKKVIPYKKGKHFWKDINQKWLMVLKSQ